MIREIYYFFRYGPSVQKRQKETGLVEFQKDLVRREDAEDQVWLETLRGIF